VVHRPAERQPVADRRAELAEQHVPAAVHADHVRIGHPDHVDPLFGEPVGNGGDVGVGRVRHGVLPLGAAVRGIQPGGNESLRLASMIVRIQTTSEHP
jgi:hypothetical protein